MGMTMPMREMNTSGKMQYPRTEVDLPKDSVDERFDAGRGCSWSEEDCDESAGDVGGDMSEKIIQSEVLPSAASP
jgi:hypothetical protein